MGFPHSQHSLIKNIDATRIIIQGMTGVDDPTFNYSLDICIIYLKKKTFYENTIVLL